MLTIPFRLVDSVKITALCLILAGLSWTLFSPPVRPIQDGVAVVELSRQDRLKLDARALLEDFFAAEDFKIHLTVEIENVSKEVAELVPSQGVLESEQVKREKLDSSKDYNYAVSSRNWIVGQKTVKKVKHVSRVASVHAVVMIDKNEWDDGKVAVAREALSCLLGVDGERGDQLTFLPR